MSDQTPSQVPAGHPFRRKGRSTEGLIKAFFGGNAALTIVILILIIVFLLREGLGFFPEYRKELQIYREAGLEFVDIARKDLTAHEQMVSLLNRGYFAQVNAACRREMQRSQEATALSNYFTESTASARDALIRVSGPADEEPAEPVEGAPPPAPKAAVPAELLAKLNAKYHSLVELALAGKAGEGFPTADHITDAERKLLFDQLVARPAVSKDDPAFVTELQAALAAKQAEASAPYTSLKESIGAFQDSASALDTLVAETSETVKATKDAATLHDSEVSRKASLLEAARKAKVGDLKTRLEADAASSVTTQPVDFNTALAPVLARIPEFREANAAMANGLTEISGKLPASLPDEKANRYLNTFRKAAPELARETADSVK